MPLATKGKVWVEWWPKHQPHGHSLLISTPGEHLADFWTDLEAYASELAEVVRNCGDQKHGHGRHHSNDDVLDAYKTALTMLLTTDYDALYEEEQRRIRVWARWGFKQPPAAVMFPDPHDPKDWKVLVTDKEGTPFVYKARQGVNDIMPSPLQTGAVLDKAGVSWQRKPVPNLDRRLSRG